MSPNTIFPLPKESNTPSEKVRETSGYLDDTKQVLVNTTYMVVKESNTDMVDKEKKAKQNVVEESIATPTSEKNWHSQQNREITSIQ